MSDSGVPLASPPPTLGYAAAEHPPPPVALFYIAKICWLVPLVVGVSTLLLFAITQSLIFPRLGLLTIAAGILLLGLGVVCLGVFAWLLRRCDPVTRAMWRPRVRRLFLLLFLNLPAAALCILFGTALLQVFEPF